jgi:SAM-dependent methyltransferase
MASTNKRTTRANERYDKYVWRAATRNGGHDFPIYPTWIRSNRIVIFWLVTAGILVLSVALALVWLPGIALAILALPFLYIATVLSLASYRLSPRGGDLQGRIHQLLIDSIGDHGRLLDVGCGSGQLLVRFAKSAPGEYVGLDYWGDDWEYSRTQCARNAELEGVKDVQFVHGSASRLPFSDGDFERAVSCLTFHEVRGVTEKTASIVEALRVLAPGGAFVFVDLFDDPKHYDGRDHVLAVIESNGGEIQYSRSLSEVFDFTFPLNLAQVLKYAVIVAGTKSRMT